jgi:hypothetical protein
MVIETKVVWKLIPLLTRWASSLIFYQVTVIRWLLDSEILTFWKSLQFWLHLYSHFLQIKKSSKSSEFFKVDTSGNLGFSINFIFIPCDVLPNNNLLYQISK